MYRLSVSRGGIAQLVEHLPCKQGVNGSNPFTSTTILFPISFGSRNARTTAFIGV